MLTAFSSVTRLSDNKPFKVIGLWDEPCVLIMSLSDDKDTDRIWFYDSDVHGDLYSGARRLELYLVK